MAITKICIIGLEDYAMLTGDSSYGYIGGESVQHVLLARAWRDALTSQHSWMNPVNRA